MSNKSPGDADATGPGITLENHHWTLYFPCINWAWCAQAFIYIIQSLFFSFFFPFCLIAYFLPFVFFFFCFLLSSLCPRYSNNPAGLCLALLGANRTTMVPISGSTTFTSKISDVLVHSARQTNLGYFKCISWTRINRHIWVKPCSGCIKVEKLAWKSGLM